MTVAQPDPAESLRPPDGAIARLNGAAQRFIAAAGEIGIVGWTLGGFIVVWMIYDTVSLWTVDLRWDASEASLWAQHFAFGYKHPPMTAWLFMAWFAVFPRTDWAGHLQAIAVVAIALAVTWRLLRDHLDGNRALFGLVALLLIPLYTFKAAELNANTVTMPFWAATLLFYLRARRGLGAGDALLAGGCAGLTMLGKYWAVYLFAGMAVAAVTGAEVRRFWRSGAPYLLAAGAVAVLAPHLFWYATGHGGTTYAFVRDSVMTGDSFAVALGRSVYYLFGVIAYAAGPLALLAALRPQRVMLADIVWPAEPMRQQAVILFAVPLILPALVNLALPHRLTALWTYPNWALLPIVLYGSRKLVVESAATAAAGLLVLAVFAVALLAAPVVALTKLESGPDPNRPDSQLIATAVVRLAGNPPRFSWGSDALTGGLPFYLPNIAPLIDDPLSDEGRAAAKAAGLLIVCLDGDAPCRKAAAAFAGADSRTTEVAIQHHFLGFAGAPRRAQITVLPAAAQ